MNTQELLSPAGNLEKLRFAFGYGADAAYIGIDEFSLRSKTGSVLSAEPDEVGRIKGSRRLYGAMNIFCFDDDLDRLDAILERVSQYPIDALIVSDPGMAMRIRRQLPDMALHLSTQANCLNSDAARFYRDMGFSRIVLGRELSLDRIERLRTEVPDIGIEVFVHGAMCIAYSGRCLLSRDLTGRSANRGSCAHPCRWEYRLIEERKRPGEYLEVEATEGFSSILSSRDLCMFEHVPRLISAGVDSFKIEGRMKSINYVAMTAAAYRAAIDATRLHASSGRASETSHDLSRFRKELDRISHREYSTGFYFDDPRQTEATGSEYLRERTLVASIGERVGESGRFELRVRNSFTTDDEIELVGPDCRPELDGSFRLYDEEGAPVSRVHHNRPAFIESGRSLERDMLVRMIPDGPRPPGTSERRGSR